MFSQLLEQTQVENDKEWDMLYTFMATPHTQNLEVINYTSHDNFGD